MLSWNAITKPAYSWTMTPSLPDRLVAPAAKWLMEKFGDVFRAKVGGTPISLDLLCAVACQESGYAWFRRGGPDSATGNYVAAGVRSS